MNEVGARIFCTTAFKVVLDELSPEFECQSGSPLLPIYGAAPRLSDLILAGEPSDAVLFAGDAIDALIAKGGAHEGSRADIAKAEIAVTVPAGASHPDISTVEAFEQTLLAAKSIALSNPDGKGFSALHMQSVLQKLDLTNRLSSKIVYSAGGPTGMVGSLVANGTADIGIQLRPELMTVTGIEIVGPLPQPLIGATTFALARTTRAISQSAASLLLGLLRTSGIEVMRSRGFDRA